MDTTDLERPGDTTASPDTQRSGGFGRVLAPAVATIRRSGGRWAFPVVLILVAIILSAAGWSGTSIGTIPLDHVKNDSSLVAGSPRSIRSDEWNVVTPLLVRQSHHGYDVLARTGMGTHDLNVILDVPTRDWTTIFRPWDLPPLVLNVVQGFAARWWLMSVVLLIGAYTLLLELTNRVTLSVLFSLGLWLSPFFHWWYEAASLATVGLGMLALAAFLHSIRAVGLPRRATWLALSAYSLVGFALVLYVPFQIATAIVLGLVGAGDIIGRRAITGLTWRRLAITLGALGVVVAAILAAFYLHTHDALTAINGTIYPGHRRAPGGDASILAFLSAPFGIPVARHGLVGLVGSNQSELSSFLILGPFALLQLFRLRTRDFTFRWKLSMLGAAAALLLMSVWYFLGLPSIVASLLFLDRVPAPRAVLGIGLAGFLLMALFCAAEFEPSTSTDPEVRPSALSRDRRRRIATGAIACGFVAFGVYFWAGRGFISAFPGLGMRLGLTVLYCAGAAFAVWLISARHVIPGGLALVAFGAIVCVPINPLYHGLGVLTGSRLSKTVTAVNARPPNPQHPVWLSFGGPPVDAVVIASGAATLNGAQMYPDRKAWAKLDLAAPSVAIWNRYANLIFVPAPAGTETKLTLLGSDAIQIAMDPCSPAAGRLGVGFVASATPMTDACLTPAAQVSYLGGPVYLYVRHDPAATSPTA